MTNIVYCPFNAWSLSERLIKDLPEAQEGLLTLRQFPDGEWYCRVEDVVENKNVIVIADLTKTHEKTFALFLLLDTLKSLNPKKLTLILPYLPYMRQDKQFHSGEALSAAFFARCISQLVDHLITVDPHLHRYHDLAEIYTVTTTVLHVVDSFTTFCRQCEQPIIFIGPDSESSQWVKVLAQALDAPFVIAEKERLSPTSVKLTLDNLQHYTDHQPVIVDDMIATGGTLLKVIAQLSNYCKKPPICLAVHGVFVDNSDKKLHQAGVSTLVATNTIAHQCEFIDITDRIIEAL